MDRDASGWRSFYQTVISLESFLQFLLCVPFYDIVHIHTSEPPSALRKVLFMAVSKLLGKKVIVHFHSFSVDTTIKSKYQNVYRFLFGKADVVLVLSKYWQDELCRTFRFKDNKVKVLYNPCTTEVFREFIRKENRFYMLVQ